MKVVVHDDQWEDEHYWSWQDYDDDDWTYDEPRTKEQKAPRQHRKDSADSRESAQRQPPTPPSKRSRSTQVTAGLEAYIQENQGSQESGPCCRDAAHATVGAPTQNCGPLEDAHEGWPAHPTHGIPAGRVHYHPRHRGLLCHARGLRHPAPLDPLSFRQYGSGSAVACELASGWTMRLSRAHVVSAWPGCPSSTVRGVPFWLSPQTYVRLLPSGRNLDLCCLGMNAKIASTEVSAARVSV